MSNVLNILNELSVSLGNDVVRAACLKFTSGNTKVKEHKPRGKSTWNLEVDKVLAEMRAAAGADEKITYKMAYSEAGSRKRENNPEAQAKYEAYRAKLDEKKAAKKTKI